MRTCATCKFAEPCIGDDNDLFSWCRRYPAALFVVDGEVHQTWPNVAEDDWCGEWAAKDAA